MSELLMTLASNAITATGLLVIALFADRFLRWPAVRHLVWATVLMQLLLPPVLAIRVPLPAAFTDRPADATHMAPQFDTASSATAVSPAIPAAGSGPITLAATLSAVELAGAALLLGLALTRSRRLFQILHSTQDAPDVLQRKARRLASELGLSRPPRLRLTSERIVPMLVALPIPTIVVSKPLIDSLDDSHIDALLSHELAHARRGDAWLRPIELLVTALYWWLPTVWIARRRLRRAEEAACDALVLRIRPSARRTYAESLLRTIELTTPAATATFATGSANSRQMKERITMILKNSDNNAPHSALMLAIGFALLAMLVGPTWAPAQPTEESDADVSTEPTELEPRGLSLERALVETRLRAYTIENQIRRVELRHEMARVTESLEAAQADDREDQANEMRRSLERLELEVARLDANMDIHRLESELALRDLALHEARGSGAPADD